MKAIKESLNKNRQSYLYALKGIGEASRGNNFRIQLIAAAITIVLGVYLDLSRLEWVIVMVMIGLVLSAETFNSAIEKLVDLVSPDQHWLAGKIKDVSAGAVLILALTALAVGLYLFIPKIIHL